MRKQKLKDNYIRIMLHLIYIILLFSFNFRDLIYGKRDLMHDKPNFIKLIRVYFYFKYILLDTMKNISHINILDNLACLIVILISMIQSRNLKPLILILITEILEFKFQDLELQ